VGVEGHGVVVVVKALLDALVMPPLIAWFSDRAPRRRQRVAEVLPQRIVGGHQERRQRHQHRQQQHRGAERRQPGAGRAAQNLPAPVSGDGCGDR